MGFDIGNIFGAKPKIAKYKPISPTDEVGKAIAGNIANFPGISELGNLYTESELAQLEKILPGYGDSLSAGKATTDLLFKNASSYLQGEIPKDVQEKLYRDSAYTALRGGYAGSGMARALTARDFGLTSLDLQSRGAQMAGQGANTMQTWDSLARRNMLDPGSMLVNPQTQISVAQTNALASQQQRQNQYNVNAAPDPLAKGIFDSTMQTIGMVLSIYGGGGGYKAPAAQSYQTPNFNQGGMYGSDQNPGYFNPGYSADVAAFG